ncbi:uncharacterized protein LOC129891844 [Solanum dulcamara]|uniref:uncharacterized protein LOC129891844 n=1 Tax=Solanum dulcamara TaxID=45834 RepID=UPI002486B51C|nr:uncharacterized protein LOC129891844 [Solanum dulcamara]
MKKKAEDGKFLKFITMLKELSMNIPLIEALEQIPGYAKFMKYLVTKKRKVTFDPVVNLHHCSAIAIRLLVENKEDPESFTTPCTLSAFNFARTLCDLGASINLMPLVIYRELVLGASKSTIMRLLMACILVKKPIGILYNVLVRVDKIIFLVDFVIFDYEVDFEVPSTLGRPFLATEQSFDAEEAVIEASIEERFTIETLSVVIMNFEGDVLEVFDETVNAL